MPKRLAGVLLLALLALTGCGWQGTGTVVEKTHSDSFTMVTLVGKVPVMQTYPESWGYVVRDEKGETHDVDVNYQYWSTHEVGSAFDNREKK